MSNSSTQKVLFCFGFGYTCTYLAGLLQSLNENGESWIIKGTTRDPEKRDYYKERGIKLYLHDTLTPVPELSHRLEDATHILISAPPDKEGDPVFRAYASDITQLPNLEWFGYLSTTGVYGDRDGKLVDETAEVRPSTIRGSRRAHAEEQWNSLHLKSGLPLHIFRLAGIYGPDRSAIESVEAGIARRIYKEGHVFNRIHVKDIANILVNSMNKPIPGEIFNIADDEPAPSHDVIGYACELMGVEPPPIVDIEKANLAPITMSFYSDNKRVNNGKVKKAFSMELGYPTYREGLVDCLEQTRAKTSEAS